MNWRWPQGNNWIKRLQSWMRRNGWPPHGPASWKPANETGQLGEALAAKHLQQQGYRILARNFKRPWGEIDLIARDGDTVVYVEVKTRRSHSTRPERAVDHAKRKQLIKLAGSFAAEHGLLHHASRFDIVAVNLPANQPPRIRHFRSAFRISITGTCTRYH